MAAGVTSTVYCLVSSGVSAGVNLGVYSGVYTGCSFLVTANALWWNAGCGACLTHRQIHMYDVITQTQQVPSIRTMIPTRRLRMSIDVP